MNIISVTYGRLFNLGNYENERIEASATVLVGDSPSETLAELKAWVMAEGGRYEDVRKKADAAERRLHTAENEKSRLERDLELMRERWEGAKSFLERTGIATPEQWMVDDIPF